MDRCIAFAPKLLPAAEVFVPEGRSCPGCGQALAVRLIGKAFGHHRRFPYGAAAPAVYASGLPGNRWQVFPGTVSRAARTRPRIPQHPAAIVAESGVFQSLLPALESAARGGTKMLAICCFNEAGIGRRSPEHGAITGPDETQGFLERLEHVYGVLETVRRLRLPFMATATAAHPFDLIEKVRRAVACPGAAFLGMLTACPTGCRYPAAYGRLAMRRAVRTGFFPLYVCEQGRVTTPPERQRLPVERYLRMHHAFLYTDGETVAAVQQHVDAYRSLLLDEVRGQVPERQD